MKKKVLVLYFTQTGQLQDILKKVTAPFANHNDIDLEVVRIYPEADYPFPWSGERFFAAMPDSVLGKPQKLKSFQLKHSVYDLVILGYQPWFLSPSIPTTSILKHPQVQQVLSHTPVVTVIGARNMWLNSQEKVKALIHNAGGRLIGNIALVDRHNNLASGVSIVRWLMGGQKESTNGVFPPAGVSEKDINRAEDYGSMVLTHFLEHDEEQLQFNLVQAGAAEVKNNIMFIESKAGRLFNIWAGFIDSRKNKKAWLVVFKYYLFFALFIVSPVVLLLNMILIRPFNSKSRQAKKNYYLGLNKG
jgi:hypothetical protein